MIRVLLLKIAIICFVFIAKVSANSLPKHLPDETTKKALPKISIVVDDLGDNSIIATKLSDLPVPLTMAILPQTPHARKIANMANQNGHEVIMHLPMEAFSRPDLLGPGAILSTMNEAVIKDTMSDNIQSIPHVVGFNNHMGSLLTGNPEKMRQLMSIAKSNNWYFLDSKTSGGSIAESIALNKGLPAIGRDIFLDHHTPFTKAKLSTILEKQFERATKIADKVGHVVIICHPYPETLKFLNEKLEKVADDYDFVKLSQVVETENYHLARKN